jgi:hypothetical protein
LVGTPWPRAGASYDLATGELFVFSRADAVESDNFDFHLHAAAVAAMHVRSVDERTTILIHGLSLRVQPEICMWSGLVRLE